MLTVRLATTHGYGPAAQTPQALGQVRLRIDEIASISDVGPGNFVKILQLPVPGTTAADIVPTRPVPSALRFTLECGPDLVTWQIGPVGPNDIFTLSGGQSPAIGGGSGIQESLYVGAIHHMQQAAGNPCNVVCRHGNVLVPKDCCIECHSGNTTVKFCC